MNKLTRRPLKKRLRHRWHDALWRLRWSFGSDYGRPQGEARLSERHPELAVAIVALGTTYWDWALTMIASLREQGEFDGPIYVATDNPAAFVDQQNTVIIKVPSTRYRMLAKSCKIFLREWVCEPVMLYLDVDGVVSSNLGLWYQRASAGLEQAPMLCFENAKPVPGSYHGGIILTDRQAAAPIYDDWLKAIESGAFLADQECLLSISHRHKIGYLPPDDLLILRAGVPFSESPPIFVHITRGMIRKHAPADIREYLADTIGISRMPAEFGRHIQ